MKTKKPEPGSKEFLDQVRRVIFLGPSTGKIYFHRGGTFAGINDHGEPSPIVIHGRRFNPEKISWLLNTGEWPSGEVGFRNGINTDYRIDNLFEVVADKQLTITKSGNLFVVSNGSEQVLTTEVLDDAVQMVRSILEG